MNHYLLKNQAEASKTDFHGQKSQQTMNTDFENPLDSHRRRLNQPGSELDLTPENDDLQHQTQSQSRMTRSSSGKADKNMIINYQLALTVGISQNHKLNMDSIQTKKDQTVRSRTEESRRETYTEEKEEEPKPSILDPRLQNVEFAIAKFDYNAQKVNLRFLTKP